MFQRPFFSEEFTLWYDIFRKGQSLNFSLFSPSSNHLYRLYMWCSVCVCAWMCLCSSMFSQCAYKYEVNNTVSVSQCYMASWRSCGLVTCCCWQLPYGALESHISYCCSTDIWIYVLWDFSITKGQWTIPDWHINSEYQYCGNMKWAPNDVWAKVESDMMENTVCALIFISVTFSLEKQLHFFFPTLMQHRGFSY